MSVCGMTAVVKTKLINTVPFFRTLRISSTRRCCHSETENITQDPTDLKQLLDDAAIGTGTTEQGQEEWATSPYPKGALVGRSRSQAISRDTKTDPRGTSIILFPGQGSQFVGMGQELLRFPSAREVFDAANEVLGYDLLKLCLQGPKEELDRTIHCQPAVFTCSLAAVQKLQEERPRVVEACFATAGFSVGEITALTFAGALRFDRALKLIKVRAEAMQLACDVEPSGMLTVLYGPDSELGKAMAFAREWCAEQGIENPQCSIATYLFPHCKVIGGHSEALEFMEKNMKKFKLRACKRLPVSGAFHTDLMKPAAEVFREALRKAQVDDPAISVVSNVDGRRYHNAKHIMRLLPRQIYRPVHWEQTLHALYERPDGEYFPRSFECGPGGSLRQILKKVNAKAWDNCWEVRV